MIEVHPISINGSYWDWGHALDVHTISSVPIGTDEWGNTVFDTKRSDIGEMLYQLKYRNDRNMVDPIAETAADFVRKQLFSSLRINKIVPVPASTARRHQPVEMIALGIGRILDVPVLPNCVRRKHHDLPAKNTEDRDMRKQAQQAAFSLAPHCDVSDLRILLLDDLHQSGATSESVARVLKQHGRAASVFFLAITKTRR